MRKAEEIELQIQKLSREELAELRELLRANPRHPSLHLKRIDDLWSVRAGIDRRALLSQRMPDC
jgi:hypothetical protein